MPQHGDRSFVTSDLAQPDIAPDAGGQPEFVTAVIVPSFGQRAQTTHPCGVQNCPGRLNRHCFWRHADSTGPDPIGQPRCAQLW